MLGLSAPVKSALAGGLLAMAGLATYNLTSRPTNQTVQGVDNTTLVMLAGAAAFVVWMTARG